jgi:hypothetical protein
MLVLILAHFRMNLCASPGEHDFCEFFLLEVVNQLGVWFVKGMSESYRIVELNSRMSVTPPNDVCRSPDTTGSKMHTRILT